MDGTPSQIMLLTHDKHFSLNGTTERLFLFNLVPLKEINLIARREP